MRIALFMAALAFAGAAAADRPPVFVDEGAAIRGYDPVAYFVDSKAMKGSKQFAYEWNGATWLFSSEANMKRFVADPEKYAPQYGGYCAYCTAHGFTAPSDPKNSWSVVDDKLYLNFSSTVQEKFKADEPGAILHGDMNWPKALEH